MGRIVYQEFKALSVPGTCDIWSVLAGAANKIKIHGFELTSNAIAAVILDINFHRITAVGSGGSSSTTEELADESDGAITANVRTLDTTPGANGGGFMGWQWEQLGPLGIIFTPEMRQTSKVSEGFALTLNTATAFIASGFLCYEEL
jgi:hypothetical protein